MMPYERTQLALPYIQRAQQQLQARFGESCTLAEIAVPSREHFLMLPRRYFAAYLNAVRRNNPKTRGSTGVLELFSFSHIAQLLDRKCHTSIINAVAAAHETWGKKHFDDLVRADWPEWVSGKEIYEDGEFVSGEGWRDAA